MPWPAWLSDWPDCVDIDSNIYRKTQCICYIKLNLSRGPFGGAVSGCSHPGRSSDSWYFLQHLSISVLRPREVLANPMVLRHWGPWYDCAHVSNTHSHRISPQDFMCPSHPRGWDYRHFTIPRLCGSWWCGSWVFMLAWQALHYLLSPVKVFWTMFITLKNSFTIIWEILITKFRILFVTSEVRLF